MGQLTFLDICAGIGGFRLGLEAAGHKCVGYCEYDKFARASYEAMYDTEGEWYADDVTKLRPGEVPYADIWTFGFPCQDISIAGKQRGLSGKRSGIYYSIIDLLKGKEEGDKPTYLLAENVKNLLSINAGFDFAAVLSEMDEAGYDCRWQVLNSKDFGVPQSRERIFFIANLRSRGGREILPVAGEDGGALKTVIGGMQGYRVYDPSGGSASLTASGGAGAVTGLYAVGNGDEDGYQGRRFFVDQTLNHPKITEQARCLIARYNAGLTTWGMNSGVLEARALTVPDKLETRQQGRRMKENGEPMFTLTCQDRHGVFLNGGKIRKLTPRECFRLQGFPDGLYEKAAAVNSETQLYKQAGNAVTATVAYAVAMALPESRELLAQMGDVWEGAGDFVTERACSGEPAQEYFGDMESQDTAGEGTEDSQAEPDEDLAFLD